MRLSKSIIKQTESRQEVLDYAPVKFDLGTPEQAMEYLTKKAHGTDFKMADSVRVQTGVDQIEQQSIEDRIEETAIAKLKEIQEAAFSEAYQLGLDEGKKDALASVSEEIDMKLSALDRVLLNIASLKQELIQQNEAMLVKLSFHIAKRIVSKEVSENQDVVLGVLRSLVQHIQEAEEVVVTVSPGQLEFLETLKSENKRDLEFLKKMKIDSSEEIQDGGCKIATNYGEIDATLEQRTQKVWETLLESVPKIKAVG